MDAKQLTAGQQYFQKTYDAVVASQGGKPEAWNNILKPQPGSNEELIFKRAVLAAAQGLALHGGYGGDSESRRVSFNPRSGSTYYELTNFSPAVETQGENFGKVRTNNHGKIYAGKDFDDSNAAKTAYGQMLVQLKIYDAMMYNEPKVIPPYERGVPVGNALEYSPQKATNLRNKILQLYGNNPELPELSNKIDQTEAVAAPPVSAPEAIALAEPAPPPAPAPEYKDKAIAIDNKIIGRNNALESFQEKFGIKADKIAGKNSKEALTLAIAAIQTIDSNAFKDINVKDGINKEELGLIFNGQENFNALLKAAEIGKELIKKSKITMDGNAQADEITALATAIQSKHPEKTR